MQRRNFIKKAGIVGAFSGLIGGSTLMYLLKGEQIHFPESFTKSEKSHIQDTSKEFQQGIENNRIAKKMAKSLLQPKKILSQKRGLGGYQIKYLNEAQEVVVISKIKGKTTTKFLGKQSQLLA